MINKSIVLANSIWFKNNEDQEILDSKIWITEQLIKHDYVVPPSFSSTFLKELIALRTLVLEILSSKDISSKYNILNMYLSKAKYIPAVTDTNGSIEKIWQCTSGIEDCIISEIAQDLLSLFSDNKIAHVKTCANLECQYYYIDNSKNKSKKFCCNKCNNLIKVRRYRAK